MKTCYKCSLTKSILEFGTNKSRKDSLADECKICKRVMDNKYSESHREEARKKASDWYYKNIEKARIVNKAYNYLWVRENKDKNCAKASKYRASKLKAAPLWLTEEDLKNIKIEYSLAQWTSEAMGRSYHVDHIIPLRGKQVCGLHVPWNLQVIPASINIQKGNRIVL